MNVNQKLKGIKAIYFAIMVFAITAIVLSHTFNGTIPFNGSEEVSNLILQLTGTLVGGIFTLLAVLLPNITFKKLKNADLNKKLLSFKVFTLLRAALLEAACLTLAFFHFLSQKPLFFYEAIFILSIMVIFYPRKSRVIIDLNITHKELT